MIEIKLGVFSTKQQAQKIVEKINGKTFYNFEVDYGIHAGNYPVTVRVSNTKDTKDEVKDMLLFVMANEL
mgnify:CR=1 FL=1